MLRKILSDNSPGARRKCLQSNTCSTIVRSTLPRESVDPPVAGSLCSIPSVSAGEAMSVLHELQAAVATQRRVLSALEPGCLSGSDALRLLEVITEGERVL